MAYIFPPKFPYPHDRQRRAEQQFYDACREQLDEKWTVVYQVFYHGEIAGKNEDSDADFLMLHPKMGIFCVEVKGGKEVGLKNGKWFTIPHGTDKPKFLSKSPFKQAHSAKRNLNDWLSDNLPNIYRGGSFGHFVVFPGFNPEGDFTPEEPQALYCTANEMMNLVERLARFAKHFKQKVELDTRVIQEIVRRLHPTLTLPISLSAENRATYAEQEFLSERQLSILHCIQGKERVCVTGPAGTGKSLLARHHALGLSKGGSRVLFVCHSWARLEAVKHQLKSTVVGNVKVHDQYEVVLEPGEIRLATPQGFHNNLWEGANEFPDDVVVPGHGTWGGGVVLPLGHPFELEDIPVAVYPPVKPLFDVLIIDEAQMCTRQDLERFWPALVDGCCIYIFGDDAQSGGNPSLLDDLPAEFKRLPLSDVCRSTAEIVDFATSFANRPFVSRGPVGQSVELHTVLDGEIQECTASILSRWQRDEDVSPSQVKILRHSYFGEVARQLWSETEQRLETPAPAPDWNPFVESDEHLMSDSERWWTDFSREKQKAEEARAHLGETQYSVYPKFMIRWASYFDLARRLALPHPDHEVFGLDWYERDYAKWSGQGQVECVDSLLIEDFAGSEADGVIVILDSRFPLEPTDVWCRRLYLASSRARLRLAVVGVSDHIERVNSYWSKAV